MGPVFALLGVLAGLALASPPDAVADEAGDACVARAIDAVEGRYRAIGDLRAHFEQTSRSVALGSAGRDAAQTSGGTVQFAKPGKMRWSYEKPQPSLVVSDGETLWIYDPAQQEAQRLTVAEGTLSGAAIQFLLGEGDIRRDFRVTPESCSEAAAVLVLVPREPATYEKLEITADLATGDVRETRIVDLLGNATRVVFSNLEANLAPPADVFTFEAPEGVRVIDLGAAAGSPPAGSGP